MEKKKKQKSSDVLNLQCPILTFDLRSCTELAISNVPSSDIVIILIIVMTGSSIPTNDGVTSNPPPQQIAPRPTDGRASSSPCPGISPTVTSEIRQSGYNTASSVSTAGGATSNTAFSITANGSYTQQNSASRVMTGSSVVQRPVQTSASVAPTQHEDVSVFFGGNAPNTISSSWESSNHQHSNHLTQSSSFGSSFSYQQGPGGNGTVTLDVHPINHATSSSSWDSSNHQLGNGPVTSVALSPGSSQAASNGFVGEGEEEHGLGPLGRLAMWSSDGQGAANMPSTQSTVGLSGSDEDGVTEPLPQHGDGSRNGQSVSDSGLNWADVQRRQEIVRTNPIFSKPMAAEAAARQIVTTLGKCNANSERMLKFLHASDVTTYFKLT
jgi:hypothetical protein